RRLSPIHRLPAGRRRRCASCTRRGQPNRRARHAARIQAPMKSLIKPLLWSVALVVGLAAEPFLNAKEGEMPKKTMMYYGGFEIEEMFDASQWFADGIYKPRNIEADGGASSDTMLRIKPLRFTADQYAELPQIASSELREEFPELDRTELIDNPPDLSQRVRYAYSAFAAPNRPEDYHYLYL